MTGNVCTNISSCIPTTHSIARIITTAVVYIIINILFNIGITCTRSYES